MGVRGVAVLDAHDRLRLLDTLDCSTSLKICVEKVLYASVDALDERISIGAMASATAFAGNTATATTANSDGGVGPVSGPVSWAAGDTGATHCLRLCHKRPEARLGVSGLEKRGQK